jgi:hypothetical protein
LPDRVFERRDRLHQDIFQRDVELENIDVKEPQIEIEVDPADEIDPGRQHHAHDGLLLWRAE